MKIGKKRGESNINNSNNKEFFYHFFKRNSKIMSISISTIFILFLIIFISTQKQFLPKEKYSSKVSTIYSLENLSKYAERTDLEILQEDIINIAKVRVSDTPSHNQVKNYIVNSFRTFPHWHVELDEFEDSTPLGTKKFSNIIATWSPTQEPTENHKRIILAAHYDSKLFPFPFIAATDSAVSCGLLLDLVRTLDFEFTQIIEEKYSRMKNINQDLSIQIIFFDGEEAFIDWTETDSIYGSRHLAKKWADAEASGQFDRRREGISNIECFVLFDLLGSKKPLPILPIYFEQTKEVYSLFSMIENKLLLNNLLHRHNTPDSTNNLYFTGRKSYGQVEDDHKPFLKRGVPVLHLIPYPFPAAWHTQGDDLNDINWDQVENLATITRCFAAHYLNILPSSN